MPAPTPGERNIAKGGVIWVLFPKIVIIPTVYPQFSTVKQPASSEGSEKNDLGKREWILEKIA